MTEVSTLEDDLIENDEQPALDNKHQCESCGRWYPAFALTNVKENEAWPNADYVCGYCIMDFARPFNAVMEATARALAPPRADPKVVLAEKRHRLNSTLWATATDGTVTDKEAEAWLPYRAAVAAVDPENFSGWPAEPEI